MSRVGLQVGIGPLLGAALEDESLPEALAADARDVLAAVGLPGDPEVELTVVDGPRPLHIAVHGIRRRFPPYLLLRAWTTTVQDGPRAAPFGAQGYPVVWLQEVAEQAPEVVAGAAATLVRTTVAEVLRGRPGMLVSSEQAAAYGDGRVEPAALATVLERLLDHGVTVRDRDLVLDTVTVGLAAGRAIDDVTEGALRRLQSGVIEVHLHPDLASELLARPLDGALSAFEPSLPEAAITTIREVQTYAEGRGIPSPDFVWVAGQEPLPAGHVRLKVNDTLGPARRLPEPGGALVDDALERLERHGVRDGQPVSVSGRPRTIVGPDERALLEPFGVDMYEALQVIGLLIVEEIALRGDRLFTVAEAEHQLAQLARYYPELVDDAINAFSLPQLTRMLRSLLVDGAPIGDLRTILQRLVLFEPAPVPVPSSWVVLDDLLPGGDEAADPRRHEARQIAFARVGFGDLILEDVKAPGHPLVVLPVKDPDRCGTDPAACDAVLDAAWAAIADARLREASPVIMTDLEARSALRGVLRPELPHVAVVAPEEVPNSETIVVVGEQGGSMSAFEEITRSRVQEILEDYFGAVTVNDDACWVFRDEATVRVVVLPWVNSLVVRVEAGAVTDVARSPDLYRWVAEEQDLGVFGTVRIVPGDTEDVADLIVRHDLLGDYLDRAELGLAVAGVAHVAGEAADTVVARFGGNSLARIPVSEP